MRTDPDNSTDVFALVVRGDIVVAILGNQPASKSLDTVEQFAGAAYATL